MKKLLLSLSIFLYLNSFCQTKQFIYEYKSIPDSTERDISKTEMMVLNINKEKSEYFSLRKFTLDSTAAAEIKDGTYFLKPPAPPQRKSEMPLNDRVNKTLNSIDIEFITHVSESTYIVKQTINLKWRLLPEYITVLNYKAQKAITEFGGRKWIAWFTKEIPFQDGPYKFKGLPGLIVKIEDETKSHEFELKGIKNLNYDFVYPENSTINRIEIPDAKFIKSFKAFRKYPATDLQKRYPNVEDSEWVKSTEKRMLKDLAKDNNIIEIDLLKK